MIAAIDAEVTILRNLLEKDTLTRAGVDSLLLESAMMGLPPVETLLARDVVSDEEVAQAYADLLGLRYLDLTRRRPSTPWVLSLPENVAKRRNCIVFGEVGGHLVVSVGDPSDPTVRAELHEHFDRSIQYVVSPRYQIAELQDELYGDARRKGARMVEASPMARRTATVSSVGMNLVEQLDSVIDEAVDRRASDIHIEPEADRVRIRLRIDGRLIESRAFPLDAAAGIVSRVKVMSNLDITEKRRPQDGRFTQRSFEQDIDVRVAVLPTVHGERVTLRLLNMDRSNVEFSKLGMEIGCAQAFERLIKRPHGIILITGPTGSGKTTTLYAALQRINSLDRHIVTIEDPVEYKMAGINQVQIDHEHGVTFAGALRSILRHDPDVIMVGEIRDQETARLALEASLTGHLVFATLHTNSAVGALTRLLDMGCEPYLVASAIVGVLAQRLVRRICRKCAKAHVANTTERELMGIPTERGDVEVFRGAGCARCNRTGYFDRVGVYELVTVDAGVSDLLMNKATTETLHQHAVEQGAHTLRQDAVAKVLHGETTLEEAMRVTVAELRDG